MKRLESEEREEGWGGGTLAEVNWFDSINERERAMAGGERQRKDTEARRNGEVRVEREWIGRGPRCDENRGGLM